MILLKDKIKISVFIFMIMSLLGYAQQKNTVKRYYVKLTSEDVAPKFAKEGEKFTYIGDDKEEEDAPAGQTVSTMIADTNRLLTQGFITGPSALFGSPSLGESSFLMTKQQETQIGITESSAETGKELAELQTKSKSLSGTGAPVIINAPPAESLASLIAPTIPPIEISPPAGAGVAMGGEVLMNLET